MADSIALRYRNRDVVFEKSRTLIAARARAGMGAAMQTDIDAIALPAARPLTIGAFDLIELRPSAAGLEQDLDWLRGRPAVAVASHVFTLAGGTAPMVPNGHIELLFASGVPGHVQQAILSHHRLQVIEQRGQGSYLVSMTSGSRNPIVTAASLQAEPGVLLAEPEFAGGA